MIALAGCHGALLVDWTWVVGEDTEPPFLEHPTNYPSPEMKSKPQIACPAHGIGAEDGLTRKPCELRFRDGALICNFFERLFTIRVGLILGA